MRYILMIIRKEFLHIKADRLMVALITFPVLAQLFIIGYALTIEVKNVPVVVCDRSKSPESREVITLIKQFDRFIFKGYTLSEEDARNAIHTGFAKIAVIVPKNFSRDIEFESAGKIQIILDGQDANSSKVGLGYCSAIIRGWARDNLKYKLEGAGMDIERLIPAKVLTNVLFNPLLKSKWYMIPALSVLLVTIVTSLLTGLSIVKERENGTFEQLMVTPVSPFHVIIGKIIPFSIIGLFEISVVLIIATLWFKIPFRGNLFILFTFAIVYMMSSLGIGVFISTIARTSQQVLFLVWFVLIFFILLSGFFIPIENMPEVVQTLTLINPVRFFMFAVREIFLKGADFSQLWREILKLFYIGTVVLSMALISFNRKAG